MSIDTEIPTEQSLIATIFRHNLWANIEMCDRCLGLTDAQLDYTDPGAYGSIRMTLTHLVRAEERYLYHLKRWESTIKPDDDSAPSISNLKERIQQTGPILLETALTLPQDKMARVGDGKDAELIPAVVILLQSIHHTQEHRTQIASMLGQQGIETPSGSGWDYYFEALLQK
jgi:uncharacterized damage-inducible protein DinB